MKIERKEIKTVVMAASLLSLLFAANAEAGRTATTQQRQVQQRQGAAALPTQAGTTPNAGGFDLSQLLNMIKGAGQGAQVPGAGQGAQVPGAGQLPQLPQLPSGGQLPTAGQLPQIPNIDLSQFLGADLGKLLQGVDLNKIMTQLDPAKIEQQMKACTEKFVPTEAEIQAAAQVCVSKLKINQSMTLTPDQISQIVAECTDAIGIKPDEIVKGAQTCVAEVLKTSGIVK